MPGALQWGEEATLSKSPGYQKWPDHHITEEPARQRMRVTLGATTLADSTNVLRVEEDGHPTRYYFPRADVRMDRLQSSQASTYCPFKGSARYFSVTDGGWGSTGCRLELRRSL